MDNKNCNPECFEYEDDYDQLRTIRKLANKSLERISGKTANIYCDLRDNLEDIVSIVEDVLMHNDESIEDFSEKHCRFTYFDGATGEHDERCNECSNLDECQHLVECAITAGIW